VGRFHRHPDGTAHAHTHPDGTEHAQGAGPDHGHGPSPHATTDAHPVEPAPGPGPGPPPPRAAAPDVGDHSGYRRTGRDRVEVLQDILAENDRMAERNRRTLAAAGARAVNLMSSPGAGKTTLLQRSLERLDGRLRVGILEGDIATSLDADRLDHLAAAVALVNTAAGFGGECHLDAVMVRAGLDRLPLERLDLLVIENVGNLVCPAEFAVGEDARAMVYAVTEGEEKPLKYPVMFRAADVVVVNKIDLLPHLDFRLDDFLANLRSVNPAALVFPLSARTGEGVDEWCRWLVGQAPART
jgi:hydrogenase nickel incorporation protein HypB